MAKNIGNRINVLEKRLFPQIANKSIVFTTIGSNIFKDEDKTFTKPEGITDKQFLDELRDKGLIGKSRVVVYIPKISMAGVR